MILLIDDNKDILDNYRELLEISGHEVSAHSSPIKALADFQLQKERFTALITDFHMPEMTGLELIRTIHASHPDIKTILYSGLPPENVPKYITVLTKPYSFIKLLDLLKTN